MSATIEKVVLLKDLLAANRNYAALLARKPPADPVALQEAAEQATSLRAQAKGYWRCVGGN